MNADITAALEQLNLNKNQARVYAELLKLGLTNVGPVVANTRLHRQLVYEALDTLVEMGLASFVLKNNRKHYQASSPTNLLRMIQEKEKIATDIIPALLHLQTNGDNLLEVKTLYGQKGFCDNLRDIIISAAQTDHVMRIIGGAEDIKVYETVGKFYSTYLELLRTYNVTKELIAPENASSEFKQKFAKEGNTILKTLTSGLSSPTYTRITPEMVSIEIYSKEPIIMQIRNRSVAQGYIDHFELLWKQAKAFTPSITKKDDAA